MKPFKHHDAESVDQALAIAAQFNGKSSFIAGGTDLISVLKSEIIADYPKVVINLKTIPGLDKIERTDSEIRIGAVTRLADICSSELILKSLPALADAARSVASPEIRNMGTVGGNLCQDIRCWYYRYPDKMGGRIPCYRKGGGPCHAIKGENRYHAILGGKKCYASFPSDLAIALASVNAQVKIAGMTGKRLIPIMDFFKILGTTLNPGEIVEEIRVPIPDVNCHQIFYKNRFRKAIDFAVVSVAVTLNQTDGICTNVQIIIGAVAPVPYRAIEAEEAIMGKPLKKKHAVYAAQASVKKAKPLSQNAYKVDIAKALVEKALLSACPKQA